MKYDIYFTDLTHMGVGINSKAFPLSIGILAAYTAKEFGDQVQIDLFKFPDDFNTALRNKVPDFLCMSNYCFNLNLSYAFVEYVKKSHPEVIIIWGGPNFPTTPEGRKDFMI